MPLAPATRVGPYEILSPLGAGGMGERLRRFEQEARALGALNHPNILAIYDIGMHEGSPYVASELLEGESLRETLPHGKLPVRRVIDIAKQIASGLAGASARGIVHRDLKPDNLFLP